VGDAAAGIPYLKTPVSEPELIPKIVELEPY